MPVASPTADARCQDLVQRGITPCPPAHLALGSIVIRNGTRGAVDDSTVRAEGQAYIRSHALYVWAVQQAAGDVFLMSGAIVPSEVARTNIFRTEVETLASARTSGAKAVIEPLRTTEITLVPVPQAIQNVARQDGLEPSAYGWVDNQSGPGSATIQGRSGAARKIVRVPSGQPHPILVFGEARHDVDLGSIWYLGGEFGCLASLQVRSVCGL